MAIKVEKSYLISAVVLGYFMLIAIGTYIVNDPSSEECNIGYTSGSVCVRFCCDHYDNCTDSRIDQSFNLSMLNLAYTFDNKVSTFKKSRHEPHCNGLSLHSVDVDVKWVFGYPADKFRIKLESNGTNRTFNLDHYCFKDKADEKRNLLWQLQICNENDNSDHYFKFKFIIDIVNIIVLLVIIACLALAQRSQSSVNEKCIIGLISSILLTRIVFIFKTLNVIARLLPELDGFAVFWLFTLNFEVWFCFRNLHKVTDDQERIFKYLALICIPNAIFLAIGVRFFFIAFIGTIFLLNIVLMTWNGITVWINRAEAEEGSRFALIRKQFWIGIAFNLMIHTTWLIDFSFFHDMKVSIYHNSFMLPSIASLYTSIVMLIMCGRIGDHIGRLTRFEAAVIRFNNEESLQQ